MIIVSLNNEHLLANYPKHLLANSLGEGGERNQVVCCLIYKVQFWMESLFLINLYIFKENGTKFPCTVVVICNRNGVCNKIVNHIDHDLIQNLASRG